MHPRAEGAQDRDAPVAELVAEPLDDDVRDPWESSLHALSAPRGIPGGCEADSGSSRLVSGEAEERFLAGRSSEISRVNRPSARPSSRGLPGPSPRQNGVFPGSPGAAETITRSRVIASILQRRGTEGEGFASPGFVDHFLVELADARARRRRGGRRRARDRGWCPRSGGTAFWRLPARRECRGSDPTTRRGRRSARSAPE